MIITETLSEKLSPDPGGRLLSGASVVPSFGNLSSGPAEVTIQCEQCPDQSPRGSPIPDGDHLALDPGDVRAQCVSSYENRTLDRQRAAKQDERKSLWGNY